MNRILGIQEIFEILPQRPPYLMLDRVQLEEDPTRITALRNVSVNESTFNGHFPGNPILPGILQLEAMMQAAGVAWALELGRRNAPIWLKAIDKIRFRAPVGPGDQMIIKAHLEAFDAETATVSATVSVSDKVCSQAKFTLNWLKPEELQPKIFTPGHKHEKLEGVTGKFLDVRGITALIPHRYPFQFIDNALIASETQILGEKLITAGEQFCTRYFPGYAVCPNSVLCETAAQLACTFVLLRPENANKLGLFMSIESAQMHLPAVPGDRLLINMESTMMRSKLCACTATITRGDELIAKLDMAFALVDKVV